MKLTAAVGASVNPTKTEAILACGRPTSLGNAWAQAHSPALTTGSSTAPLIAASEAVILPTAAAVGSTLRGLATRNAQACIAAEVDSELASGTPGVKAQVSVSRVPSAFSEAGSYGIRLLARLRTSAGQQNIYFDVSVTGYGQALVQLMVAFEGLPPTPVEHSLATTLLARAWSSR
jgi:hypothetical protein